MPGANRPATSTPPGWSRTRSLRLPPSRPLGGRGVSRDTGWWRHCSSRPGRYQWGPGGQSKPPPPSSEAEALSRATLPVASFVTVATARSSSASVGERLTRLRGTRAMHYSSAVTRDRPLSLQRLAGVPRDYGTCTRPILSGNVLADTIYITRFKK